LQSKIGVILGTQRRQLCEGETQNYETLKAHLAVTTHVGAPPQ